MDTKEVVDVYSAMTTIGLLGLIAVLSYFLFRYIKPKYALVYELNLPFKDTHCSHIEGGIKLLPRLPEPFIIIKGLVFTEDDATEMTIGADDGKPGGGGDIEFFDTSAGVKALIVIKVSEPVDALYNVEYQGEGAGMIGFPDYKKAVLSRVEGLLRRKMKSMELEEAMALSTEGIMALFETFNDEIKNWGVELTTVTILDFILDPKVIELRDLIFTAAKKAEAADKEGQAKGDAIASELKSLIGGNDGLTKDQALQLLVALRGLEAMKGSTMIAAPGNDGITGLVTALTATGNITRR